MKRDRLVGDEVYSKGWATGSKAEGGLEGRDMAGFDIAVLC